MTPLNKDRDYYRMLPTSELEQLTHYGKDVDWRELSIALAERLADIRDEVCTEVIERD
jgi:hypothetical protein